MTRWISGTIVVFAALVFSEVSTDQFVHRYLVNDVGIAMSIPNYYGAVDDRIHVLMQFLSQHMGTLSYLFWPVLMAIYLTYCRLRYPIMVLFIALTAYSVWYSDNQTAMLALTVSLVIFVSAMIAPKLATYLLAIGWMLATMAIVPLTYYAHDTLQLQLNPHIPSSGQARFPIWYEVAKRTWEDPLLGHGVVSLQALVQGGNGFIWHHAHSHNVFLQTWYETGFVGAALLMCGGLVLITKLTLYQRPISPFELATFAVLIVSFTVTAWEVWVPWHLGIIALVGTILLLTDRLISTNVTDLPLKISSR